MSVAVVLAFAGALIAAVGAGMLAGQLIRSPRSDLAAWTSVLLALAVALGAQTMGFAIGFSNTAFRAATLSGTLLAPLWTAWGLVELAARTLQARFATRLVTGALTIVPGVILILDPLGPGAGTRTWPGEGRYMALPRTALTVVHVVAVAIALLMMTLAAVRTRRDTAWWHVFVPVAAAGAAVLLTVSLGLTLPNAGYPVLAAAATGSVWFAASRSIRIDRAQLRQDQMAAASAGPVPRRGRRRRGQPPPDAAEPATAGRHQGQYAEPPFDQAAAAGAGRPPYGEPPSGEPRHGEPPLDIAGQPPYGEPPFGKAGQPPYAEQPFDKPAGAQPLDDHAGDRPATLAADGLAVGHESGRPHDVTSQRAGSQLFGLIAIYTLREGCGDEFDRLAEEIVESVRRGEPDTLLFIVHSVPKAPMQRIFYEVYRDRMAYAEHRRRPDVVSFFAKHRPYVLATNVIELDLRYAKASALPSLATMFTPDTSV